MNWYYQIINNEKGIQSIDFDTQVWHQPKFTEEVFFSLYNAMKVLYIYAFTVIII